VARRSQIRLFRSWQPPPVLAAALPALVTIAGREAVEHAKKLALVGPSASGGAKPLKLAVEGLPVGRYMA